MTAAPVALITGIGPGTGRALAERFAAGGYRLALLSRNAERLKAITESLADARAFVCDVADGGALANTLETVKATMGAPKIVVHNAVGGAFGNFLDIDPAVLSANFQTNCMALLHIARATVPDMIASGGGAIIATGNTSAYRGKAGFAAFAPSKAAQRILLESIARHSGPMGVHAAYVAIDAVIDVPWTRKMAPDKPDDFFAQPADIAEEVFRIAHQPRTTWSFESVIRPFGETW
ncbi:MAG: SDR family NAD(P)-dependent oxidoreductase [Aquimonas sp.]|nr:SDR family NAD(P)-dependent oxidoreductase [Aquimonas sp.]